jgi:hypothetical protein
MIRIIGTVFWACLFSVLGIGLVQGAQEAVKEQSAAPVIVVEEPIHDFGQVSQGEVVTHDFQVLNQGTVPLEIKKVKPG